MNQSFLLPSFPYYSPLRPLCGPSYSHVSSFLSFLPALSAKLLLPHFLSPLPFHSLPHPFFHHVLPFSCFWVYAASCFCYICIIVMATLHLKGSSPTLSHFSSSLLLPFLGFRAYIICMFWGEYSAVTYFQY